MVISFQLAALAILAAGQVTFNGFPVPGATVSADKQVTTTDIEGRFSISGLPEGPCMVEIRMQGFAPLKQELDLTLNANRQKWELTMLSLAEIQAAPQVFVPAPAPAAAQTASAAAKDTPPEDLAQSVVDGFLINGSMRNGADSPFAQLAAFGNHRTGSKGLYNGGIGVIFDNSALDARPFSLTGQNTPKAAYNRLTGVAAVGGPLKIPHLFKRSPDFFAAYQWTRNNNSATQTGLMPDLAQRNGILSAPILDPTTGVPFPNNTISQDRISPQARALLGIYPLPNFNGGRYNYQIPILSPTHQDALQFRWNKTIGSHDEIYGRFALQSQRSDTSNLFGFLDTTDTLGINTTANWSHRLGRQWFLNLGIQFSRKAIRVTPYFENRENVSANAGIMGNNQEPVNWGPPTLTFAGGVAGLADSQSSHNRNQTTGLSYSMLWNRGSHNITYGVDFRREEFNYLSQQDPRGTFTFTGGATGSDFGDFLLGIPDTSSIAFGNADKYFRESVYDAFLNDDWRISPELTVNAGLRWEYGAPITELFGRLVNLDIAPGFAAVTPVVGRPLIHPDKRGIEPRVGLAWRPVSGSSMVIRAGYGIYYDTSVYQSIAVQMAQQPPLSTSLRVENSAADPLTLANGFVPSPTITGNTFAADPHFRPGYAQNWQIALQRDLPASLQVTATYLGIKGTGGAQEYLPNTFPAGAPNPCGACPTGFAYLTTGGNSTRQAGQLQLRRRLHSGLTANLLYTFSKSIDDDATLGGLAIAQNWLDLRAERALSTFDQRHLLSFQTQYTTGGRQPLLKEWIVATDLTAGSGLPETAIYLAPVTGTGVTGTIRADYTGTGYTAPQPGHWGTAGRDTITGPAQFTWSASLGRIFRITDRFSLDMRADVTNPLNHVTFTVWNSIVNSPQFGLPAASNAMRSAQITMRLRF